MVRPRDTRATKPPINGDQEITHAQSNIVYVLIRIQITMLGFNNGLSSIGHGLFLGHHSAIPPKPQIQTNEMSGGTISTHIINSRMVRPRDTRATKPPINGDQEPLISFVWICGFGGMAVKFAMGGDKIASLVDKDYTKHTHNKFSNGATA
jgi:hypothetical protein